MKKSIVVLIMIIAALAAGCGAQPTRVEYIGAEAARELALKDAGFTSDNSEIQKVDMGTRDGIDYYQVEFSAGGGNYHYDIDAITGRIIDSSVSGRDGAQPVGSGEKGIESAGGRIAASPEPRTAQPAESQAAAPNNEAAGEMISEEQAKEKALEHAGVSESGAFFVKSRLDRDDGRLVYDVEFYTDGSEYDYEIDPYTGEVLQFDYDAEYYTVHAANPSQPSGSRDTVYYSAPASQSASQPANAMETITADEAKAKALAQVPGATIQDIRGFETDYDDGRLEYEGTIYYNGMEYEFEIDGYSGAIRSWEVESIYD